MNPFIVNVEMYTTRSLFFVFVLDLVIVCNLLPAVKGCGTYQSASPLVMGSINSPSHPASYSNYTRCIWLIEAPSLYQVEMNITFAGQNVNSACSDYVEVRDGSIISNIQISTCSALSSYQVRSAGRWLWLLLKSDRIESPGGLSATYTAVYAGSVISNITSPVKSCRTHQFSCSNKECISTSYKCDGYNDCGCIGDCDEDNCSGIAISLGIMYAIGCTLGFVIFLALCMGTYIFERKFHWAHIKKMETEQKNHG